MKISISTLILEFLVYAWLYVYRYDEAVAPGNDVGIPVFIFIGFFPYVLFIIRNILIPKPKLSYNLIVSLILLTADNVPICYSYLLNAGAFYKNEYLVWMKPAQIVLALPFFLAEYLISHFLFKKRKP